MLEKTLERPLDSKEIKPVNPKGNQSWITLILIIKSTVNQPWIGRTDAEAPIFWPPYVKRRFTGKDPDAGKDWRREEKGTTEDETVGWHHQFNGHEWAGSGRWQRTRKPGAAIHGASKSEAQLSDWRTTLTKGLLLILFGCRWCLLVWFQEISLNDVQPNQSKKWWGFFMGRRQGSVHKSHWKATDQTQVKMCLAVQQYESRKI